MMNCKHVRDLLSAYLDRELSGRDLAEVRAHLASCESCQAERDSLASLKSLLGNLSTPDPAPDFEARLLATVHAAGAGDAPRSRRVNFLFFAGIAAGSAVATLALLSVLTRPVDPTTNSKEKLNFAVQRDQVYSAGADPTSGVPLISASDYGDR